MSSQRYARALLSGAAALRNTAVYQGQRNTHRCAHSRSLTLATAARQQLASAEAPRPGSGVISASTGSDALQITFCDGRRSEIPYSWLRDNCQCHKCSSCTSLTQPVNTEFELGAHPEIIQSNVFGVVVDWSDGHISKYPGEWLHQVAHTVYGR
ncbi:gamma-butyrobetaine dioxygenase-like [Homarus americanus]|uniref:Trimethyllysine dioxygenase-like n=1 Tax=Homarus americanus TaxID=6706 RepID=A0A8J5MQ90_HOMAM|nr:gamma-butyrobetaine dioxygenase-like [Homarus americanus]KAG7159771.1 Trimethyllysine dioxygenase-like [Homarus americanus]